MGGSDETILYCIKFFERFSRGPFPPHPHTPSHHFLDSYSPTNNNSHDFFPDGGAGDVPTAPRCSSQGT
jgi:hypothetical protein